MIISFDEAKKKKIKHVFEYFVEGGEVKREKIIRYTLFWKHDLVKNKGETIHDWGSIEEFFEKIGPLFDSTISAVKHFKKRS